MKTGKHREPLWLKDIVASLSHDHKNAICLAGTHGQFIAADVDIEPVMSYKTMAGLESLFCYPEEEDVICRTDLPYELSMTLLYFAKESLYKAISPQLNVNPDFHSARLKFPDAKSSYLTLVLTEILSSDLPVNHEFSGYFYRLQNTIITFFIW